ncbi:hypothetical protein CMV_027551 [Castanea mollissima]|uniref:C2 domain-containing protein n=1 Tax=Castanea mollissima TaxID=60419 RepID=A0A8J4QF55_9ROSI|nr:hypothetical protein CMV_027551 [Castanea mollissima]
MACDYKTLEVEIESAKGLPYVNHFKRMKSYAVVYIWDIKNNLRSNRETSSVYKVDGSNPTWNYKVKYHIDFVSAKQNHYALVVKLKSCRKTHGLPDKSIGEVRVLISELLEGSDNAAEDTIRVTKNVQTSPEKFEGELAFSYNFGKPIADPLTEVNIAKKKIYKDVAWKMGKVMTAIVL